MPHGRVRHIYYLYTYSARPSRKTPSRKILRLPQLLRQLLRQLFSWAWPAVLPAKMISKTFSRLFLASSACSPPATAAGRPARITRRAPRAPASHRAHTHAHITSHPHITLTHHTTPAHHTHASHYTRTSHLRAAHIHNTRPRAIHITSRPHITPTRYAHARHAHTHHITHARGARTRPGCNPYGVAFIAHERERMRV